MIKLVVSLNALDPNTGKDIVLGQYKRTQFDIEELELLINKLLVEASTQYEQGLEGLKLLHPEVSIALSADSEELIRPVLNLSARTIGRMSIAGASLDFDPYV